jgi:NAD+ diphosphatase
VSEQRVIGDLGYPALRGLALSRGDVDRTAAARTRPALTEELLADPGTQVLALRRDRFPVGHTPDGLHLVFRAPDEADRGRLRIFLGRAPEASGHDAEGAPTAYLGVVEDGEPGEGWANLRAAGLRLGDRDAGLVTTLLALANWHATHGHCPRCGASTEPVAAGWVRRCPEDRSEHFPRTDPSVIMSVVDEAGRLLLGRGLTWPEDQFSVLAGFVEPGESLEAAVAREVLEESGVRVEEVRYLGSQPWPFPSSLMLGFTAAAVTTELQHDPEELAEVRWVTREEYAALLASGGIRVPGGISIARRLIEAWLGQSVEAAAGRPVVEGWRPAKS